MLRVLQSRKQRLKIYSYVCCWTVADEVERIFSRGCTWYPISSHLVSSSSRISALVEDVLWRQDDSAGMDPARGVWRKLLLWMAGYPDTSLHRQDSRRNVGNPSSFAICRLDFAVFSLRRPIVFGHILSGYVFIGSFYIFQFFLKIFYRRNMGHVGVMPGMVSHGVSFFYYLSDQFRLRVNVGSDNKKSGFYLMFFQCIQGWQMYFRFRNRHQK